MTKQSNEILEAADRRDPTTRNLTRRDKVRKNRDEFAKAQEHADTLGLDEKVSDGLRRAMSRFTNSPLTLMMEVLNDPEQPWDRKFDAANKAFPYLHRKLEDKHGTQHAPSGQNSGGTGGSGPTGPTINLTVNRPAVTVNERQSTSAPKPEPKQTASQKHKQEVDEAARPKVFKKPKAAK